MIKNAGPVVVEHDNMRSIRWCAIKTNNSSVVWLNYSKQSKKKKVARNCEETKK